MIIFWHACFIYLIWILLADGSRVVHEALADLTRPNLAKEVREMYPRAIYPKEIYPGQINPW